MGNLVVRMAAENVGQGYEPNPLDPSEPRFIQKMNGFEMKFDFETLQPFALYPVESV
ncbi:Uma2 domain-containing protein [Pseudomonas serboccidentalis]